MKRKLDEESDLRKRKKAAGDEKSASASTSYEAHQPSSSHFGRYHFEVTDERDHAETPLVAYQDLEPILYRLSSRLKKKKDELLIYDPYYCQGSCIRHLNSLGFSKVHNQNRDCYADWASKAVPPFDLLVTNPPYSADHMRRAVEYSVLSGKPFCLLMPAFVARKPYFTAAVGSLPILFLGPQGQPYHFSAPDFLCGSKAFTPASFNCVWFINLGQDHTGPVKSWWEKRGSARKEGVAGASQESGVLAESIEGLPQLALDPQKKRREEDKERRSWRKKLSRQRKQAAKKMGLR
jgi:hypothetical protein